MCIHTYIYIHTCVYKHVYIYDIYIYRKKKDNVYIFIVATQYAEKSDYISLRSLKWAVLVQLVAACLHSGCWDEKSWIFEFSKHGKSQHTPATLEFVQQNPSQGGSEMLEDA